MKKRILCMLAVLLFSITSANASSDKVHVSALESFSTIHPSSKIDVKVIADSNIGKYELKTGDVIHCNVVKVTDPKRGKRAASFAVCPISYTSNEHTVRIEDNFYGKYASKIISKEELKNVDAKQVGKKAARSVGNYFVKGIAPVASLAEGMIKNEEGNRLESGVKQVYKDSPLSYAEKGKQVELEPGEQFYLIFKPSKSKNTEDIIEEATEDEIIEEN